MRKALFFLSVLLLAQDAKHSGPPDPDLENVPFEQWLAEGPNPKLRVKLHVPHATLSFHQRLASTVEVVLDGADLDPLRGNAKLMILLQITAENKAHFRHRDSIDLSKLDENVKAAEIDMTQDAFFLPGDYELAVVVFDTATREHSSAVLAFRINAPNSDFLAAAWSNLPPVEFIDSHESPESWYLPEIEGRLAWASSVQKNIPLTVVLNLASSPTQPGTRAVPSGALPVLVPILKALTQTGSSSLSPDVHVIDINRKRLVFSQTAVKDFDWPRAKASLNQGSTASIDVHSLADRHQDAQFFVSEIRRILRTVNKPGVLVVLSPPVGFDSGEDLAPISLEALPATNVFYIRCYAPRRDQSGPVFNQRGPRGRGPWGGTSLGPQPIRSVFHEVLDQLEATLKPLHPKVFDVESPEQITKALKEIRDSL